MKDGFFGHVLVLFVLLGSLWYGVMYYKDDVITYVEKEKMQTILIGGTQLKVQVADEPAERTKGLSGVKALAPDEGMLFMFDSADDWGIWMKDMLIPIDILWVTDDLAVVHIEENVSPDTFPQQFSAGVPTRFVIEAPAYFARNNAIGVGDTVYIPETIQPKDLRTPLY